MDRRAPRANLASDAPRSPRASSGYADAVDWRVASGLASGLVALAATIPYIRATFRRQIRPSAVTWAGWWLFSSVVFAAQMLSEPSWSAVISGTGAAYCGVVMVLAVRVGGVGPVALDATCGALGVAAVVVWQVTQDPRLALVIAIAGDVCLCIPTLVKSLRDPASEMGSRFLVAAAAALLGAAAARHLDFLSIGWPVYLALANTTIGLVALRGRAVGGLPEGASPNP